MSDSHASQGFYIILEDILFTVCINRSCQYITECESE
jgi:hypothetical protein